MVEDENTMSDTKIVYICDGSRCSVCNMDMCMHTTDIEHAKNFQKLEDTGVWMEKQEKEVIRCKDCKYYTSISAHCEIRGKGLYLIRGMNDFCSRAERKSDENNATD